MEKKKEELIEWTRKLAESGKAIIVEGQKDRKSLEFFGIKDIVTLKKPLYLIAEEIAEKSKEAIILTDFDRKGKELYGRLKKDLERNGVKVDNYFREFLQKNTKLSHIEGLRTYVGNLG
ncbi:topoisomerase [Candidatus Woesearchaeota archaeon CG10_big_fil_rev_8_21_14_0_10_44_13]|nr:MAG: topoisomerase [Candidatus Woesearchaeota archaeon CG10_big_fil_rev_8_21_14_0_10_44_13]